MLPLDERGRAAAARLTDRYTFDGFLGQGGFAAVYRVRNLRLDRVEALKVLFEVRGSDPRFAARFEREARVAASLEHPNIVRVYDFGNAEGTLWYSMQYVDGPTLRTRLERHGRMRGDDAAGLLVPLLEALEVVHRGGVVHRDVKPDNIILDGDDRPYLMDFGIVKRDDNVQETLEGKILGTPGYLSPEQLRGHPLDGRSDLYAAGVTLYQMITGDIPFRSDDRIATMTRRLTEDPEPPSRKVPDLEPELERIVLKALSREREDRYATAAEMRAALESFLAEGGAPVRSRSGAMPRLGAMPVAGSRAPGEDSSSGTSMFASSGSREGASVSGVEAGAPAEASRPGGRTPWLAAGIALVLAAVAFTAFVRGRAPGDALSPASTRRGPPEPAPTPDSASSSPSTASSAPLAAPPSSSGETSPARAAPTRVVLPHPARRLHATAAATQSLSSAASSDAPVQLVPRVRADVEEEAVVNVPPALAATCSGKTVGITVVVAADGTLKSRRVISSAGTACDDVALDALSRYKFRAERDEHDRPVDGRLTISVRY